MRNSHSSLSVHCCFLAIAPVWGRLCVRCAQSLTVNISKIAFTRCIKGNPSGELTNREQSCVRDVAAAVVAAQKALGGQSG